MTNRKKVVKNENVEVVASGEMNDIGENLQIWKNGNLSSGETTLLEKEQEKFNSWLCDEDIFWDYELDFNDDLSLQNRFFQYVADYIKNIPAHRFILRYFLYRYRIALGDERLQGLYEYVENGKWRITSPDDLGNLFEKIRRNLSDETETAKTPLSKTEYDQILSAICFSLECEYSDKQKQEVCGNSVKWSTYFNKFLKKPTIARLRELALALDWDWKTYAIFRKKALKSREIDYFERDEVLMLLTLKYARVCGLHCYPAYCILKELYPKTASGSKPNVKKKQLHLDKQEMPETSTRMGQFLQEKLEKNGQLCQEYQDKLFREKIPSLEEAFDTLQNLRAEKKTRSCMQIFIDEWEKLTEEITREYFWDSENTSRKKHEVFRSLYGENVERLVRGKKTNRINDLNDDEMIRIAPMGKKDYYLDSQEFLDTRIRDNDFYEKTFTVNEARQRNILLTVIFLNFLTTLDNYDTYRDRIVEFDITASLLLSKCGFYSLYSGYAYDAFLKLLLSCEDPEGLFRFIWHVKTGTNKLEKP